MPTVTRHRRQRKKEEVTTKNEARLVRNPDLLIYWDPDGLVVRNLHSGDDMTADPAMISILDVFGRPRRSESAVKALKQYEAGFVLRATRKLRKLGWLLAESEVARRLSRLKAWKWNVASAHYHVASRDMQYLSEPREVRSYLQKEVLPRARPARFKRYRSAVRRPLSTKTRERCSETLEDVLKSRQTVRRFSRTPARFEDFAAVVGGTWGRTGWLVGGSLGRFATKSSPSAGALHPIECYVIAWNVRGLAPGLYHYDVGNDDLRRLRSGNLHAEAVRAASGQRWVKNASFLCVMTAMFSRSLWKYESEDAYRDIWLDAGHLAQTFCLLATARGLGPFTTAAIQDTFIEKLIGVDGIQEFPVYLCGAGVPAKPLLPSVE